MEIVYTAICREVRRWGIWREETRVACMVDDALLGSGGYTVAHDSDRSSSYARAEMGRGNK